MSRKQELSASQCFRVDETMLPLFLGSDEIKHLMKWVLRKLG